MTLPDLARDNEQPPPPENVVRAAPRAAIAPPAFAWFLRTTAASAFVAAVVGVMVAPGLRGLAKDRVVDGFNRLGWTLANFVTGLLVTAVVYAAVELSRSGRTRTPTTTLAASVGGLVVAIASCAVRAPLPAFLSAALAIATAIVVVVGGLRGLRVGHTRAVAMLMLSFATAGLLRIVAWELARRAGDSGNTTLYATARMVATAALGFEGLGQVIAAAWLGTRSRFIGQALSSVAIGLAFVLTYAAAAGASVSASPWQAAAHIALATASSLPQPYGPPSLAVFMLSASILLAGVAAAQRGQVVAVITALGLSLIGRGAFDVPIHALASAAAGLWLILATTDERAIWRTLLASRGQRGTAPRAPGAAVGG